MNKLNLMLKTMFISLCLLVSAAVNAQVSYDETIYLKNGSVIKGAVIEETRDQLKIKTPNGSVFIVGTYDVEKIVRNNRSAINSKSRSPSQSQTPQGSEGTANPRRRSYNDSDRYEVYETDVDYGHYEDLSTHHSLYKGFVDLGYSFGTGNGGNAEEEGNNLGKIADIVGDILGSDKSYDVNYGRFEFSTSHGIVLDNNYNYIPMIFLGAGVGGQIYSEEDVQLYLFPFFAQTRIHFIDNWIAPFIDFKAGYSWGSIHIDGLDKRMDLTDSSLSISGLYLSPSVGIRFATGSKSGINLSLGYTHQRITKMTYSFKDSNTEYSKNWHINLPAISLKLGMDF
jgi:hypothetical protein